MADPSEVFINYDNVVHTFLPIDRSVLSTTANAAINIPANSQRTGLTIENDVANAGVTSITDPSGTIYTLGPGGAQSWAKYKSDLPTGAFVVKHNANTEIVRIKEW
jgi:hypothetical protein